MSIQDERDCLAYDRILNGLESINDRLFEARGWIVTRIAPSSEGLVEVVALSGSGAVRVEFQIQIFQSDDWSDCVVKALAENHEIRSWLDNVDFGNFTKSQLFHALIGQIVLPSRLSSPLEIYGAVGRFGVATQAHGWLVISGIRHRDQSGLPAIDEICAAIPASDNFSLSNLPEFFDPSLVSLDSILNRVAEQFDQTTCGGRPATVSPINPLEGILLSNPAGLVLLHQLAGNFDISIPMDSLSST